jgi:hypothetical protein
MDVEMGDRKPIEISRCLTITSQGVLDDYVNAWADIGAAECLYSSDNSKNPLSSEDKGCIKKILGEKRQSYGDYIFNTHGEEILITVIENSDKKTLSSLNRLADSYNLIRERIAEDLNLPLAMKFVELAAFLIQGE